MNNIIYKIKFLLYAFIMITFTINATSQVVSNDQCTISGSNSAISLIDPSGSPLTSVKSGLDFNLNLTLPGIMGCNGSYNVTINTSDNLMQGNTPVSYPYPFVNLPSTNTYENATTLSSASGLGINIPFKFKPGVTCNGELGSFNVVITLTCANNTITTCSLNVALKAIAINYWVVKKYHVFGNLSGGVIDWDVVISNSNSNPSPGIGDLNIVNGTITDAIAPGSTIISVTGGNGFLYNLTGLSTPTASWNTGTIPSSTYGPIVYRVRTYSCSPAGTVVTNCANYNFCLGKSVGPKLPDLMHNPNEPNKRTFPTAPGDKPCCDYLTGNVCATVTLTGLPTTSANFSKTLTYGNSINYAQGCEGEYQIVVSNNGNIPLNSLTISDIFPAGINVTNITVSDNGTGLYMAYSMTGLGIPTSGNTSTPQTWATSNPTGFTMTTNSGSLMGEIILIKIRFTITASTGTITNCADLTYSGTYNGWHKWCGVILPPPAQNTHVQSCVPFTVQKPKAIPGIRKCIPSGQQSYMVGDIIHFRIVVSNHGAATLSGVITDYIGFPPQNLSLVGSVTYSYGSGYFNPYSTTPDCISINSLINPSIGRPSWVQENLTSPTLVWTVKYMPGNCILDQASYLIIEYDAKILPQSFGQYCNNVTFNALTSLACYNVIRVAQITTTKQVSTTFVEPGQSFNYSIVVKNEGSVTLKNINVVDLLPACVTSNNCSANKLDANGAIISSTNVNCSAPYYTFPVLILQPGESVELKITVTRNANDQSPQCCNLKAKGIGTTDDLAAQVISDEDGPVCVKSGLCCDIANMNVGFWTTSINGGIVPVFFITSGPLPVQEVDITLMDYHVEYNDPNCKPLNMGNLFGHIQPFVGSGYNFNWLPGIGAPIIPLQTVVSTVNNSLTWTGPNPIYLSGSGIFNGIVAINFIPPDIVNLDCCSGTVYYCFKVRIKDVNCNVCEKIVCGSFIIPKKKNIPWKSQEAKDQYKIQSLENNQNMERKIGAGENPLEFFKRNK